MKNIAIYPGSFDPVTYGHLDLIERGCKVFDRLIVAVLNNSRKEPLFSVQERIEMLKKTTANLPNVEVDEFDGLLVNYVRRRKGNIILRGLRALTDFEYESEMALVNRQLSDNQIEILFMMADISYTFLSSSMVKEVGRLGGDIKSFVPEIVEKKIKRKFGLMQRGSG